MAIQLYLSESHNPSLDIRLGGDRRRRQRRAQTRDGPDRRRRQRRTATVRSLLFTLLTLAIPHQLSPATLRSHLKPVRTKSGLSATVRVSIESVVGIPPWRAYNHLIREAARKYSLDPVLIRAVIQTESACDPFAISRAGAMGLMQLMPELAVRTHDDIRTDIASPGAALA